MTSATFVAEIDWDNDGTFVDSGEDVTARVLAQPGIVCVRGRDTIRALAPPAAGACEFALNNASRDYSPANGASPLAGQLIPGRAVRVRTTAPSAVNLWRGTLDDLPQHPRLRGGTVGVPALGTLARLRGVKVSTAFYQDITTDLAFEYVCAAAGLAAAEYSALDTGRTTLTAWWCADDDAFEMLARIVAAEGPGATIYEDGDGVVTFHSRHYRLLTTRCTTSQATFGTASEPKHSPPFGYEPNLKGVVNRATLVTKTFADAAWGNLAEWSGAVAIPPGGSHTVRLQWATPSSFYGYNWYDSGEGFWLTLSATVGYAQSALLTFTNPQSFVVTLTLAQTNGYASTSSEQLVTDEVDTSASQAAYGVRPLPTAYNPWPYLDEATARSFCNAIVVAYQEPRATVRVTVRNANATRLAQQLAREISDRITVVEGQTGLNGPVLIERIRHEIGAGGRFHTTQFDGETIPAAYGDWYVVGTSAVGTGRAGF